MTFDKWFARNEAQAILDGIKDGKFATFEQITQALVATGDIGHIQRGMAPQVRSAGLDQALLASPEGTGGAGRGCLVAGSERKHRESPWSESVANVD